MAVPSSPSPCSTSTETSINRPIRSSGLTFSFFERAETRISKSDETPSWMTVRSGSSWSSPSGETIVRMRFAWMKSAGQDHVRPTLPYRHDGSGRLNAGQRLAFEKRLCLS